MSAHVRSISRIGFVCLAMIMAPQAWAQAASSFKAADIVGSWSVASIVNTTPDGKRSENFSAGDGTIVFTDNGRFAQILARSDIPKIASNNRDAATAQENQAITHGSLAFFGSYSFDPATGVITFKIERSTFPNWNGTDQKRQVVTLTTTDLVWKNPGASVGGTTENSFKRAK